MRYSPVVFALALLAVDGSALADEPAPPPGEVVSPAFQAPGTPQVLTRRGAACLAKILKTNPTSAPATVSVDDQGGLVTTPHEFYYSDGDNVSPARATAIFEAKPGRFRIRQTHMQLSFRGNWSDVNVPAAAQVKLETLSKSIADCVISASADNW